MTIAHHPDAKRFPMMSETELDDLAADIAKNGLRDAIKLDPSGEFMVDGRNREIACERADVAAHYECLPEGTDIFAYVVSTNLHRRHLTVEQRHEIIAEIARRNPDLSNRQIAKIAGVHHETVSAATSCPVGGGPPAGQKTKGEDGKQYPRSGKYSAEQKDEIMAAIQMHRSMPERELAEKLGVSHGTIQRYRREMDGMTPVPPRRHGRAAAAALSQGKPPSISLAEEIALRKKLLPSFELSREELGMGSREYGAEQHPDYPLGWTRDNVHREKYGRIQIYTPAQIAEQEVGKRFHTITVALKTISESGATADDIDDISDETLDLFAVHLKKFGPPAIDLIFRCLARIKSRKAPKLTIVKP